MKKPLVLRKVLVGALLNNFWLKLFSILFAVGFYASIHTTTKVQRTLSVPIIADMPPGDRKQLMSQIPNAAFVTVESRQSLDALRSEEIGPILLNLKAAEDVPKQRLTEAMIPNLPPRVRIIKIIPSTIEIRWENRITREIDVQVGRLGEPAKGMEVKGMNIEPKVVKATGPESLVNVIQVARTEAFDVSGLEEGEHKRQLALRKPPSDDVRYEITSIEVTVEIVRKMVSHEFVVPIEVVGLARALLSRNEVKVTVTGPPETVDALSADSIIPYVKVPNPEAKTGSVRVPVELEIVGVKDVKLDPPKVIVRW